MQRDQRPTAPGLQEEQQEGQADRRAAGEMGALTSSDSRATSTCIVPLGASLSAQVLLSYSWGFPGPLGQTEGCSGRPNHPGPAPCPVVMEGQLGPESAVPCWQAPPEGASALLSVPSGPQ